MEKYRDLSLIHIFPNGAPLLPHEQGILRQLPQPDLLPASQGMARGGDGAQAVSYTHLDVYKRQFLSSATPSTVRFIRLMSLTKVKS